MELANIARIILFLLLGIAVLVVLWSVIMKQGDTNNKAIEAEKIAYQNRIRLPIQAQLMIGDLVKIIDKDMETSDPKIYTFYYALEPHTMGIGIYNKKYVYMVDSQMFMNYSEIMGKGVLGNKRLASIDEKVTVTKVVNQTTNQVYKVEDMECFKNYLVEDTSTHYNDQVEHKEQN